MGYLIFTTFALLDSALYAIVRPGDIPNRDLVACLLLALFVAIATKMKDHNNSCSSEKSRRFTISFQLLSSLEVIATIILPWVLVVRDYYFEGGGMSAILVSHLFLFQAQIALEGPLMAAQENSGLLFTYTCLANGYRIVPLLSGIKQSRNLMENPNGSIAGICQIIAVILWVVSSFIFIPFIWYPELDKTEKIAGKSKEKSP